jgi:hypothetical protein
MSEKRISNYVADGPDKVKIYGNMENEKTIAKFWGNAKFFVESMDDIGRVTLLLQDGEGGFYLSSIQDRIEE